MLCARRDGPPPTRPVCRYCPASCATRKSSPAKYPTRLRFTAPQTRNAFIWPARHKASSLSGANYPPMGQRFRLKASVDIASFGPNVQVILRALKKYGMFLADNGSSWFLSGAPDPRWDDNELHQLGRLTGADFEAVDESALMADPNSGRTSTAALPRVATEVEVLEFRRDPSDYFLTVDRNEIAALDSGLIPGWARTGEAFFAYAADNAIEPNMSPVCRFFGRPGGGQHSHFFSAYAEECAGHRRVAAERMAARIPECLYRRAPGCRRRLVRGGDRARLSPVQQPARCGRSSLHDLARDSGPDDRRRLARRRIRPRRGRDVRAGFLTPSCLKRWAQSIMARRSCFSFRLRRDFYR